MSKTREEAYFELKGLLETYPSDELDTLLKAVRYLSQNELETLIVAELEKQRDGWSI